jgi:hypothetical protein
MLRKVVRVLATLVMIGSVGIGAFATYVYLTPSDEQRLYDQKHQEAIEKLQKAEAAKGTVNEARLAKEAKEAAAAAEAWGQGFRERTRSNRLGILASGTVALLSFIVLLITLVRSKSISQQ